MRVYNPLRLNIYDSLLSAVGFQAITKTLSNSTVATDFTELLYFYTLNFRFINLAPYLIDHTVAIM